MMREMEKVFEALKEEFNRKISSDSFISYFVKTPDVSEDVSFGDSFEDISLETNIGEIVDSKDHSYEEDLSFVKLPHCFQNPDYLDYDNCLLPIESKNIIMKKEMIEEVDDFNDLNEQQIINNEEMNTTLEIKMDKIGTVVKKTCDENQKELKRTIIEDVGFVIGIETQQKKDSNELEKEFEIKLQESLEIETVTLKIDQNNSLKEIFEEDIIISSEEVILEEENSLRRKNDNDVLKYEKEIINENTSLAKVEKNDNNIEDQELNITCKEDIIDIRNEDEINIIQLSSEDHHVHFFDEKIIPEYKRNISNEDIKIIKMKLPIDDSSNKDLIFRSSDVEEKLVKPEVINITENEIKCEDNTFFKIPLQEDKLKDNKITFYENIEDTKKDINILYEQDINKKKMNENISEEKIDNTNFKNSELFEGMEDSPKIKEEKLFESFKDTSLSEVKIPAKPKPMTLGLTVHRVVKRPSLHRMMWSEMPEVIESDILKKLSNKQIQLQEAMFEIITSEASYYKSLMILTTHFFDSDLFKIHENKEILVSSLDKHHIFSNVILIMSTSQKFLNDLDQRWLEEKPQLSQLCDVILKHVSGNDFQNYVTYLRNQEYQSKALKRLTENEVFKQQLNKLENSPVCGKLSMDSYLMLPMQRLTRLKLLVDAILKLMYCEELRNFVQEDHINTAEMTLEKLKKLLDTSDFEKGFMDQKSTLLLLMNKMDFPPNFKRITISDKYFIKEDELRLHQQNSSKNIRKFSKKKQPTIRLILFNDLLILAKRKALRLMVIDYCDRINIEATETRYKSIVSSMDVSETLSCADYGEEIEEKEKSNTNSLYRSKTSITSDDWKRLSVNFSNSFKSMPLINRGEEQEIINNSFSLRFIKSQTDIFSIPIVFMAKNRVERDEWMALLSNPNLGNNVSNFRSIDGKLHKTTSLRHSANRREDFGMNKNQSVYSKRKDDEP